MQRTELAHVLRASAEIAQEKSFVLVGGQVNWMSRAVFTYLGDLTAICPDLHDLAVSKCAAGRDKVAGFVEILLKHRCIDIKVLLQRINLLDATKYRVLHITQWSQRRALEAGV